MRLDTKITRSLDGALDELVLDIGFQKGDTMIELVTFPQADASVEKAAVGFLDALETR